MTEDPRDNHLAVKVAVGRFGDTVLAPIGPGRGKTHRQLLDYAKEDNNIEGEPDLKGGGFVQADMESQRVSIEGYSLELNGPVPDELLAEVLAALQREVFP